MEQRRDRRDRISRTPIWSAARGRAPVGPLPHRLLDNPAPQHTAAVYDPGDQRVQRRIWVEQRVTQAVPGRIGQSAPLLHRGPPDSGRVDAPP
ncbi:hypothetical protein NDU88_008480 [Pleurodeles waltl]|uniref:Uncharacterized protein n=1 Tax=Pleurodeles waltl TaxID=8319 RepID=A0AAV7PQH9_PLEWA|nr:hypothetical protein NDU88_008480 [Pleurodeles waltl]